MRLERPRVRSIASTVMAGVFDAYVAWREESATVDVAYGNWLRADRQERRLAFAAYSAALDREEHAAEEYRRQYERAERRGPIGRSLPAGG